MKKIAAFLLTLAVLSLAACQSRGGTPLESSKPATASSAAPSETEPISSEPVSSPAPTEEPTPEPVSSIPEEPDGKVLIAYFSLGRNADYPEGVDASTSASLTIKGGGHTALDLTGAAPEELYTLVAQGTPVVVWVTIEMADRYTPDGWYTETGEYVDWSTNDHGAVLIGYSDETVTIADPISGQIEYSRRQFESVFESRGRQCVIISETQEAAV